MNQKHAIPGLVFMLLLPAAPAVAQQNETSLLWPDSGASFVPHKPLPDFSYAGYRRGEVALPERRPEVSVVEFGAKPDDETDDSAAFRRALAESAGRCIAVPAGRYILSDRLVIETSQTVLQGQGPGRTVLYFTRGLEEIEPRATRTGHGSQTTAWSWSGGLIQIGGEGSPVAGQRVKLQSASEEGGRVLRLEEHDFEPGDELMIEANEIEDGSLARYLYRGDVRESDTDIARLTVRMVARVEAVEGAEVRIDRPLRFEARPEWVSVGRFEPAVVDSAVERLTIEFPVRPYRGHFQEDGLNAFAVTNAAHCWLRDVEIVNADSGAFVSGHFNTLEGPVFRTDREPDGRGHTGHHAITANGTDNLITGFDIQTRFIHDLTVTRGSVGNVWSEGRGADLSMDHHRWAPYQNLFTDLDTGRGTRYFSSGGTGTRGRHSAAGGTFWNIRGERDARMPGRDFGPAGLFFVGVQGFDPAAAREGWHVEAIEPGILRPPNLHAAQLKRRLEP